MIAFPASLREVLIDAIGRTLAHLSSAYGLMVTTSRRTGAENVNRIEEFLEGTDAYLWDGVGESPYFGILAWADEIDPKAFWQIHRSTLVSVKSIAGLTRDFRGHLLVRLKERKETLPVSEPYLHRFRGL